MESFILNMQKSFQQKFPSNNGKGLLPNLLKNSLSDIIKQLIIAASKGHTKKIDQILSINCSTMLDKKTLLNSTDQFDRSPIFYAVLNSIICVIIEHPETIESLLNKGANLYKRDINGRTM